MDFATSFWESVGDGKRAVVKPKDLRFTQLSISRTFRDREHLTVEEAVDLIKRSLLNPDDFGELTVHRDGEGVVWCEDNRRLYALRKAGVEFVRVKFISNNYFVRRLKGGVKDKLKDPAFMPKIRDAATPSPSSQQQSYALNAENVNSLLAIAGAVYAAVGAGYAQMDSISSSSCERSGDGKRAKMNPKDLRFTQLDIASYFTNRAHPKVEEAVDLIKRRLLNPDDFGELTVHRDREGVVWSKNNRRLYVLRKAGVPSVKVKFISNNYDSRRVEERDKVKLKDSAFMPRIRGGAMSSSYEGKRESSVLGYPHEGEKETNLLEILGAVSSAVETGYAVWKLFKRITSSDNDGNKNNKK